MNNNTSVVLTKEQPVVVVDEHQDLLKLAVERGSDVGTLERLMVVRKELLAERAKANFDNALAAFQSECPIITKRKSGAKNAYKYAPLDDIVNQTRELIRRHGFSYTITSKIDSGWVCAYCTLKHVGGHSEVSEFKAPIDNKNPMMTDPQRYGGAMTFAKRYAFTNALGILTSDEDLDGRAEVPQQRGPKIATEKTRQWMVEQFRDIKQQALAYAIDCGLIMPDETLDNWPLSDVPTTPAGLANLRDKIEAHK